MVKRNYARLPPPEGITLTDEPVNLARMARKRGTGSFTPEQAENVRRALEGILNTLPDKERGNKAAVGRRLAEAVRREHAFTGQTITQILGQVNRPSAELVSAVATYLGVSLDELLEGRVTDALRTQPQLGGQRPTTGPSPEAVDRMAVMLRMREVDKARYPALEIAILYHLHEPRRWSPVTLDLARRGQFASMGCDAWSPPQWVSSLDKLEALVQRELLPPQPPSTPIETGKRRP